MAKRTIITPPQTPGYYWAHFRFKDPGRRDHDYWEPVSVEESGEVFVFGKEWADTPQYWGIVEFGERLKEP